MADEAAIELVTVIANPSEAVRDDHEEQLPCTELEMQDVEAEGNTSSEEMGPAEKEIDAGTEHGIDGGMEQGTPNDTEQGLITVIANPLPESEATCDEHRQNTEHEPRDIVAEETASESMKREINTGTERGIEGGTERKTPTDMEQGLKEETPDEINLKNGVSTSCSCKVGTENLFTLPPSLDTFSLSPSDCKESMEKRKQKRRERFEVSIVVAIIATVWVLMMFPLIFYHTVPGVSPIASVGCISLL